MKRNFKMLYSIICCVGLFQIMFMLSSCSNDEEQSTTEGPFTAEQMQIINQIEAIRGLLISLANVESVENDFYMKNYTPVYGKVLDESNPFVRSVKVNDSESAYEQFDMMVRDKSLITPTADGYSVQFKLSGDLAKLANRESFGKLTYHQGNESNRVAYIDVEIPNMPNLQRIDFVPSKLWGDNDGTDTAFKLGELVYFKGKNVNSLTRGAGYYLCVREYDGQTKGCVVRLNEGFDQKTAVYYGGDNDYSWSPFFKGGEMDVRAYTKFLFHHQDLLNSDKEFLKNEGTAVNDICPPRFMDKKGYIYSGDRPAWIITDTKTGDFHIVCKWTVCDHFEIPAKSVNGEGKFDVWKYDWGRDWQNNKGNYYFYTISVLYFDENAPDGVSSAYNPAPDPKEDDDDV